MHKSELAFRGTPVYGSLRRPVNYMSLSLVSSGEVRYALDGTFSMSEKLTSAPYRRNPYHRP